MKMGTGAIEPGLVKTAAAGDPTAMHALLRALGPHVLKAARRILVGGADAEDAAQEAMTALLRDLPMLRDPSAIIPFATRTVTRIAVRIRQRHRREHERRAAMLARDLEASAPSPAAAAAARERAERLLAILDKLPEEQCETLVLRYVMGFEPAEIAAAMQVPVNTVRSRARLGRESLARRAAREPALTTAERKTAP